MSKKTNKKEVLIEKTKSNRMDSKTYYMRNTFTSCYLDCNNVGNVYFSLNEPCKWEFKKTETPGAYFIRHINTNLFLTSDEHGDLFTTVSLDSTLQKWNVFNTSSPEVYAYQNLSNGLYILVNNTNELFLYDLEHAPNKQSGLFYTFQRFPKK